MAIREVRIYFEGLKRQEQRSLTRELFGPFTFYMDAVMRGRFREYSGTEMKGVNIINLHLWDASNPLAFRSSSWNTSLNVYEKHALLDFKKLVGTRAEKLLLLIDTFVTEALDSDKPQVKKLLAHIEESRGRISADAAIQSADEHFIELQKSIASDIT